MYHGFWLDAKGFVDRSSGCCMGVMTGRIYCVNVVYQKYLTKHFMELQKIPESESIDLSKFEDSKTLLKSVFDLVKQRMGDDHKDDNLKMVLSSPTLLQKYLDKYESLRWNEVINMNGRFDLPDGSEKMICGKTEKEAIDDLKFKAQRRIDFVMQMGNTELSKYISDGLLVSLDEETVKLLQPLDLSLQEFTKDLKDFFYENIAVLLEGGASNLKAFLQIAKSKVYAEFLVSNFDNRSKKESTQRDFLLVLKSPNNYLQIFNEKYFGGTYVGHSRGVHYINIHWYYIYRLTATFNVIGSISEQRLQDFFENFLGQDESLGGMITNKFRLSNKENEEGANGGVLPKLSEVEKLVVNVFNENKRSVNVLAEFLRNFEIFGERLSYYNLLSDEQIVAICDAPKKYWAESIVSFFKDDLVKLDGPHISNMAEDESMFEKGKLLYKILGDAELINEISINELRELTIEQISGLSVGDVRNFNGRIPLKALKILKNRAENVEVKF